MGYTCCVPKCKTNYPTNKKEESESLIPLFRFSSDQVRCQKWIKAIPRKNCKISDICKIYAKHFFVMYSSSQYQFSQK